ncbi:MAG: response regulator transcription factor [Bacteroidota bacterium]
MSHKVLVIEDEKKIARFLELELKHEGYDVDLAYNGREGLAKIEQNGYDLILLDIFLPELNGMEVCRRIRKDSSVPIIIVSAKDEITDKVYGLDIGADDYLTKPFAIEELLARMRVHLRKSSKLDPPDNKLRIADLVMDLNTHEVVRGERKIALTNQEYELLKYLLENKGIVLSRSQIGIKVWGYDFGDNTNVVDVYISYLRRKVDQFGKVKLIHTIRGAGYVLREENK